MCDFARNTLSKVDAVSLRKEKKNREREQHEEEEEEEQQQQQPSSPRPRPAARSAGSAFRATSKLERGGCNKQSESKCRVLHLRIFTYYVYISYVSKVD